MVSIILDLEGKKQILNANNSLKESINAVKEELEDHLTAINENTNEIESNYELIAELALKLEKIEERLEDLELILHSQDIEKQEIEELNKREKSVFLTLYKEEKSYINYAELAALLNLSESSARHHIETLIKKGLPIIKKVIDGRMHFKLNPHFRELQTKHNLLKIKQDLTLDMFDQRILV